MCQIFLILYEGASSHISMDDVICEKQECDACTSASVTFPVPGIQHRQENILIIVSFLDNSDSVHCLYLLVVYMYIVCFYMFYVQRATW